MTTAYLLLVFTTKTNPPECFEAGVFGEDADSIERYDHLEYVTLMEATGEDYPAVKRTLLREVFGHRGRWRWVAPLMYEKDRQEWEAQNK